MGQWYNSNNRNEYYEKYKYIILMGMNKEELLNIKNDDKMIRKVKRDVETLNGKDEFHQLFTDAEDQEYLNNGLYAEGLEDGMSKGIETGIEQGIITVAKDLLNSGMDIGTVAQNTDYLLVI